MLSVLVVEEEHELGNESTVPFTIGIAPRPRPPCLPRPRPRCGVCWAGSPDWARDVAAGPRKQFGVFHFNSDYAQEHHRQQTIIHQQPFNTLGVITSQLLSLL